MDDTVVTSRAFVEALPPAQGSRITLDEVEGVLKEQGNTKSLDLLRRLTSIDSLIIFPSVVEFKQFIYECAQLVKDIGAHSEWGQEQFMSFITYTLGPAYTRVYTYACSSFLNAVTVHNVVFEEVVATAITKVLEAKRERVNSEPEN